VTRPVPAFIRPRGYTLLLRTGKRHVQMTRCRSVSRVGVSAHIGRLQAAVGQELGSLRGIPIVSAARFVAQLQHHGHTELPGPKRRDVVLAADAACIVVGGATAIRR
jgi:hypothetical protein